MQQQEGPQDPAAAQDCSATQRINPTSPVRVQVGPESPKPGVLADSIGSSNGNNSTNGGSHGCCQGIECCVGDGAAGGDVALLARQGERVSLTVRRVLKVHKALGILGIR
jgi:hypothetical protein